MVRTWAMPRRELLKRLTQAIRAQLKCQPGSRGLMLAVAIAGGWGYQPAIAQESLVPTLQNAQVVRVANGETVILQLENQQRQTVQLACVAAPEPKSGNYGRFAKESLVEKLPGGTAVRLLLLDQRRFSPSLGVIYRGDTALQLSMVEEGAIQIDTRNLDLCTPVMAYQGDQGANETLADALLTAETQARQNQQGLWQQTNPIPPWEIRNGMRDLILFGGGLIVASVSGLYSAQFLIQEWRDRATPQVTPDDEFSMSLQWGIKSFQTDLSGFLSDTSATEQFVQQLESEATPDQLAVVYRHFRYAAHTAIAKLGMGVVFPVYRDIARLHYTRQKDDPAQVKEAVDRDLSDFKSDHGL